MCTKPRIDRIRKMTPPANAAMAAYRAICPICQNA
jgi:hypothetical protein